MGDEPVTYAVQSEHATKAIDLPRPIDQSFHSCNQHGKGKMQEK